MFVTNRIRFTGEGNVLHLYVILFTGRGYDCKEGVSVQRRFTARGGRLPRGVCLPKGVSVSTQGALADLKGSVGTPLRGYPNSFDFMHPHPGKSWIRRWGGDLDRYLLPSKTHQYNMVTASVGMHVLKCILVYIH